jgi:surfactin family lipopeptide synthetase A
MSIIFITGSLFSSFIQRDFVIGPSSFEQEAIWLDELMRFRSDKDGIAVYHIVLIFRILTTDGKAQLVTSRLQSSLQLLVEKHASLRTCLQMSDDDQSELRQRVLSSNSIAVPLVESWIDNNDDLYNIITDEETNRSHFDLVQGHVFRTHVIRYHKPNNESMILFNFHHSIFDGTSEVLFLNDLRQAYATEELINVTNDECTYLDYARWERQLDMSAAVAFWNENLKDHQILELPYDRICPTAVRTGRGSSVLVKTFHGDALLAYARQQQVTLFQLCLAIYYSFLYKLTGGQDLIVGSLVANRTRPELGSIIGMFANLVPYRLKIKPQETFRQLVERVQNLCHNVFPHLRLPFQTLSKLLHPMSGIVTAIDFETITAQYSLDNDLQLSSMTTPVNMTPFDLSLLFKHDPSTNMINCTFEYSLDVFDRPTIEIFARRFQLLFTQLLEDDQQSVYRFSILLDNEQQLLHHFNPSILIPEFEPCHWILSRRADDHPQKIGIIMEEQCLSYGEILHYAQQWAEHILATCHVNIGDILLQVVERSIHIVLGVFAIWMCGAVYAPFNPRDSLSQLHSRIDKLGARVVLIHKATRAFATFDSNITVIDTDRIPLEQHNDVSILDSILVKSDYLSHILFTSGSTGEPKAVSHSEKRWVYRTGKSHQNKIATTRLFLK